MAKKKKPEVKRQPVKPTTATTGTVNVTSDSFVSLGAAKLTTVEADLVSAVQHLIKANDLLAKVLQGKQLPRHTSWYVVQEPTP